MHDAQAIMTIGGGGRDMNEPVYMSDRKGHNGITEDSTATTLTAQEKERPIIEIKEMKDATSRNKMLQILQKAYGEEAVCKWCIAVMERIQQTDILQQGVHESSLQGETENREELDGDTPPRPDVVAEWIVRDMRKQQECRCSSQRSEPTEQRNDELTESMQELSQQNTQACKYLFNMWSKGKGLGLLRQALSEIQEVWKSVDGKGQSVHCNSVVRRLTPLETERLQGMPDNWSKYGIDENGKVFELSDSARYKLQGNGIATPFWKWMLKRISAQYERTPTLGSLFDGQGSFPMIWEGINGKGTALWSSEIEKAAIAVTKYHFGEE